MTTVAAASVLAVAVCPFASVAEPTYIGIDGIKQLVPGGNIMGALDVGGGIYQTPNSIRVDTPQGFGILTDIMADHLVGGFNDPGYDESAQIAEANAYQAVMKARSDAATPVVVVGFSQGSDAASNLLKRLESEEYDTSDITFVLAANPVNPDGGLKTRFSFLPSVYVPLLGVTIGGDEATTSNYTEVIIVTRQYDGFADFPKYAINVVAVANALVGIVYLHSDYDKINVDKENAIVTTTSNGKIEHRLIPTETVPLLMLAEDLGLRPEVAEALDPFLRAVIETGYDRPDASQSGTYPEEAQPLRLLPPPSQWAQDVQSVADGFDETLQDLGNLSRPAPVSTPSLVDSIPSQLNVFSRSQQSASTEQKDPVQQPELEGDDRQSVERDRPETNVLRAILKVSRDDVSSDNGSQGTKRVDPKNVNGAAKSISDDVKDVVKSVTGSLNRKDQAVQRRRVDRQPG